LPDLHDRLRAHVDAALADLGSQGALPAGLDPSAVALEAPRDPAHGDLALNAAMVLAKAAGMAPRAIAAALAPRLAASADIDAAEIAGPGFINLRLSPSVWLGELAAIRAAGDDYGRADAPTGRTVNVEYVSANPTGPMHMGHCRGAVVGDALGNLLEWAGERVVREYYINDAGGQVDVLARSVHLRYREALGEAVAIPEGLYPGDYLIPVGEALAAAFGDRLRAAPEAEWLAPFRERAVAAMMDRIRADLLTLGIRHDRFSSEAALQASGAVGAAEAALRAKGLVYEGALDRPKSLDPHDDWEPVTLTLFRASQFGDDQDRPLRKSDGSWTYFGADAAYHFEKAKRSDALVNIWGADHAGTVSRIKAAVCALTDGGVPLDVKIVQMVALFRDGQPVKMSKRSGNFVTLADVVEEVGPDVVRFIMLTRRPEAPLDFDFARVVEQSKDNPVFYVQYAHARIRSLGRRAAEAGIAAAEPDLARLDAGELALIKLASGFPRLVRAAAAAREPHRIAFFLQELAAAFHARWNAGNDDPRLRFLVEDDPELTAARLALADALGQVIRNGLAILGVAPVEEMR
jgi:arginyl-tRNA synthetase